MPRDPKLDPRQVDENVLEGMTCVEYYPQADNTWPDMPLVNACSVGYADRIKQLYRQGVDMNAPFEDDPDHYTPLMVACRAGAYRAVLTLVNYCDVDLDGPESKQGFRAIDIAALNKYMLPNQIPIVEFLKYHGSQHTWWGAAYAGDLKRLKEFIDNGQDVDEVNHEEYNWNAVEMAHEAGMAKVAKWLIAKGGTMKIRNAEIPMTKAMMWDVGRMGSTYYADWRAKNSAEYKEWLDGESAREQRRTEAMARHQERLRQAEEAAERAEAECASEKAAAPAAAEAA